MAKPIIHARSSANKFGGQPEDYLEIHDLLDSSKSVFSDNRHRALTHNSWFFFIVERIFGHEIDVRVDCTKCEARGFYIDVTGNPECCARCNQEGSTIKKVSVRDVCEQHVLEDFGGKYIPTASDYLEGMEFQEWMNNGISGAPTSHRRLAEKTKTTRRRAISFD